MKTSSPPFPFAVSFSVYFCVLFFCFVYPGRGNHGVREEDAEGMFRPTPRDTDAGVHDGMGRERSRQAWLEPLSTEERSEDVRGDLLVWSLRAGRKQSGADAESRRLEAEAWMR
mgnify:CR=1 FL=1